MTIVDEAKKLEKIEDFYSQAREILNIVNDNIKGFHYVNGYNLLEYDEESEQRDITIYGHSRIAEVNARKKQLIIELSRAGEYAIKYILSLKQMEDYPQQTYEEFLKKAIYSIGEKGVGNTYINQYHVDQSAVDDIKLEKEKHKLQPLHDYSYLFYILKRMYPDLSDKVYESFIMSIKSFYIEKSYFDEEIKQIMTCFPQIEWASSTNVHADIQNSYIEEYDKIRNESGDAFIRLRYIENNEDNKQYDLESVLYYINYLIFHIELIHDMNHNDIHQNISLAYSKSKFLDLAHRYVSDKISKANPKLSMIFYGQHKNEYEEEFGRVDKAFEIIGKYYNPILPSLNVSQIRVYEELSGSKMDFATIYQNIVNNVMSFEKVPQLFGKIPLLLSTENTNRILNVLRSNGMEDSNILSVDSAIFCIPYDVFSRIMEKMHHNGESLLIDNQLNENIFKYLDVERLEKGYEQNGPPPLPIRRHL